MSDHSGNLQGSGSRSSRLARQYRGQPPPRQVTFWNRANVALEKALSRGDGRQRASLDQALAKARREASREVSGSRWHLAVSHGLRRGILTSEVADALACLVIDLEPRMGWANGVTARDLQNAWRMLNGGIVLDPCPADLQTAFEIASLVGAMVGRFVLVITDGHTLTTRIGERLTAAAGELALRVTTIPEGASRHERRACYRANIVCVEASTLALDLLHDQQQSARRQSPLRQRFLRLGATSPVASESMLPEHPALGLCRDAGAVLGERALENHALWSALPYQNVATLAQQTLELADLLRPGDHFTSPLAQVPLQLTEAGHLALETMAQRRGGLLMNRWLREPAIEQALRVRYHLKQGEHFAISDDGRIVPLPPLHAEEEESSSPPGLLALLSSAYGKGEATGGVVAQARNQQLLAGGVKRLGGMGLTLPGLAQELTTLHDLRIWDVEWTACVSGRFELYETGDISQLLPLIQEWCQSEAVTPGWVMTEAGQQALGIAGDESSTSLESLVEYARQDRRMPGFEAVTHVLVVLDEGLNPECVVAMLHDRLPGLLGCRVVVLRPGFNGCRRRAVGPFRRWLISWRLGRYLRRRLYLKRRVLQRDETLHQLTRFHGDGGG